VVLDLGTGTGAIALALASERPAWQVSAIDQSADAVALALDNARVNNLGHVNVLQSDWFNRLGAKHFDLIVSNPPYVEHASPYLALGDLRFEPKSALVSGIDGLDDIRIIIEQSKAHLNSHGWLLLEHGYEQGAQIRQLLASHHFSAIQTIRDLNGLERVSLGQYQ
jgi:release factor glutamine methyltransferase